MPRSVMLEADPPLAEKCDCLSKSNQIVKSSQEQSSCEGKAQRASTERNLSQHFALARKGKH